MPVGSENDFVQGGVFHLYGKGRDGQLRLISRPFVLGMQNRSERSDWKSGFWTMSVVGSLIGMGQNKRSGDV
jgi:hypothetical protein